MNSLSFGDRFAGRPTAKHPRNSNNLRMNALCQLRLTFNLPCHRLYPDLVSIYDPLALARLSVDENFISIGIMLGQIVQPRVLRRDRKAVKGELEVYDKEVVRRRAIIVRGTKSPVGHGLIISSVPLPPHLSGYLGNGFLRPEHVLKIDGEAGRDKRTGILLLDGAGRLVIAVLLKPFDPLLRAE